MENDRVIKKTRSKIITWTAAFAVGFYSTFVLQQFWNWFATPILCLPSISFWEAYALICLISLLVPRIEHDEHKRNFGLIFSLLERFCIPESKQEDLQEFVKSKTDEFWEEMIFLLVSKVFSNTFTLAIGWCIHKFLI